MKKKKCDIAVIGGGPAGMMAAGTAASEGADTLILEKNSVPGKKLLISGKGRCNITNAVDEKRHFIDAFGKNGKFLYPAINALDVNRTLEFFRGIGIETKVERGNRVFPLSDSAKDVQQALLKWLKKTGVSLLTGIEVKKLTGRTDRIENIVYDSGDIEAASYIIATGGLSYPGTGSTGDGYRWAKSLGHTIVEPEPSLTSIILKEPWTEKLAGLHLNNINAELIKDGRKLSGRFGEAFFTREGLDGPVILDLSGEARNNINSRLKIRLDLKPALDHKKLDARILREIEKLGRGTLPQLLRKLLPAELVPVMEELSGIQHEKKISEISREERRKILHLLKSLEMEVAGTGDFKRAIVTKGGISLKEVDPKTMRSRLIENLFFAGEILDIDAVTGGYNLQACWSTGYLSGISASAEPAVKHS
jgi:predicted Rossmann fold flavoprotein